MRLIPYYDFVPARPPRGACVRAVPGAPLHLLYGAEDVWIESPDPSAALAAAARAARPVLNSLPADEASWAAYGAASLRRFERVVLLPFAPGAKAQSFDANLDAALALADRFGVPPERRIVDICVLPRRSSPDPDVYASRIAALRARGYAACGGVNNYVYGGDEGELPAFGSRLAAAGLAYGIVSARFVPLLAGGPASGFN